MRHCRRRADNRPCLTISQTFVIYRQLTLKIFKRYGSSRVSATTELMVFTPVLSLHTVQFTGLLNDVSDTAATTSATMTTTMPDADVHMRVRQIQIQPRQNAGGINCVLII